MSMPIYDAHSAIEQIEKCDFECEGGPLKNNVAYAYLRERLLAGPKFLPGQWVFYEVKAEIAKITLSQWKRLCVVGVAMSSNTERQIWTYALSAEPPRPWSYGSGVQFNGVKEDELRVEEPVQ